MNGTTNPVKQYSAILDLILNQIRATRPGEPETFKAVFLVRWLPYLDAAYPIEVKALGDLLCTAHNRRDTLAGLDSSWERDIMAESLLAEVLHDKYFTSGIYLVKTSPFQKTAAMLERLGVVTTTQVRDRMHTFTHVKAVTINNYLDAKIYAELKSRGMVETVISTDQSAEFIGTPPPASNLTPNTTHTAAVEALADFEKAGGILKPSQSPVMPPRGINNPDFKGWGGVPPTGLPPARPVAVTETDLVLALRRLYEEFGRVNQSRLLQFIIKVLAGELPDESLNPQPLIEGLDVIASGMTGDFTADYIAQQALYAYNNRQHLTVATGVKSNE